jgi:hypothetical protein
MYSFVKQLVVVCHQSDDIFRILSRVKLPDHSLLIQQTDGNLNSGVRFFRDLSCPLLNCVSQCLIVFKFLFNLCLLDGFHLLKFAGFVLRLLKLGILILAEFFVFFDFRILSGETVGTRTAEK